MKGAVLQVVAVLTLAVCIFGMGYKEGFDACQRANERTVAAAREKIQAEAQQKAKENAETVSNFVQRIQDLEARNRSLSSTASRLSERLRATGMPGSGPAPGGTCEERLARCQGLLGEGVELLAEGAGLSERIAARKDAVSKLK